MARPITSYFTTINREEYLAQATSRSSPVLSAAPPQPKKRPVGRPRKVSINDQQDTERGRCTERPRKRSADDSDKENSSTEATKPTKEVRRQYSYQQKERVVEYARHHGVRAAARQFNIPRKNIQRWFKELKDKNVPFESVKRSKRRKLRTGGRHKAGRKLTYPLEVDEKLLEWLLSMRERHLCVSTQMLRDKSKAVITQYNPSFQGSEGWLRKFMWRHSIVLRAKTSVAQKLPKDLESKIEAFYKDVKNLRTGGKYSKEMIGNMDETPLYFDMVPSRTLEKRGAKEVRVKSTGAEKRHLTVVLACTGAGKMLPPMIIFKGKTARVIKGLTAPPGFIIAHQSKAWMDGPLMQRWVKEIWLKYTEKEKSLLVFDTFKAHITDEVVSDLASGSSSTILIPGGCTSVLQPLDVSLNKPFKAYIRAEWLSFMERAVVEAEEADAELSDDPFDSSDEEDEENADVLRVLSRKPKAAVVVKPASRQTIINWIVSAWRKLEERPALVSKSFEVTGITVNEDDASVRNEELQGEIAAGFDVNSDESESEEDSDEDDLDDDSSD